MQQAATQGQVTKLAGTGKIEPQQRLRPPVKRPMPRPADTQQDQQIPAKPDRKRVDAALDALLGRTASADDSPAASAHETKKAKPQSDSAPEADSDQAQAGDMRSGLLAAKRRAREELNRKRNQ